MGAGAGDIAASVRTEGGGAGAGVAAGVSSGPLTPSLTSVSRRRSTVAAAERGSPTRSSALAVRAGSMLICRKPNCSVDSDWSLRVRPSACSSPAT
ncbi:hypothetical protein UAJ10_10725 [Nitrospirillum sp. BR 11164]|uniref:hypothetical protein n=1 Tax=Nitrospirillum sp. BR 11164 TaxID=3104324 RepID=UPI002AFDEF30|nr:hypothetical protein [Nitrospirillum sp. BR 11164]MEA1649489.1 hypothetical protein [Nitrospirillum sp. BR 11164]